MVFAGASRLIYRRGGGGNGGGWFVWHLCFGFWAVRTVSALMSGGYITLVRREFLLRTVGDGFRKWGFPVGRGGAQAGELEAVHVVVCRETSKLKLWLVMGVRRLEEMGFQLINDGAKH